VIGAFATTLIAVLFLTGAGPAAAGAPPAEALNPYPADRLLPFWRQYTLSHDPGAEEAMFTPAYRLDPPPDTGTQSSGFWLEAPDGALLALDVDRQGYLVVPEAARSDGFFSRDTRILHDGDRPLPAIRLEIHARLEPGQRYAVGDLAALVSEVDQFQRSAMGFAALMAPRFDVVVFRFDGPAPDGWHVTARGERRPLGALHDTLFVRMTGRVARTGGEIILDAAPHTVVLEAR